MLCQLGKASFAVLPPSLDTIAFVDDNSNITRVSAKEVDGKILGYKADQDRVLIWSQSGKHIRTRHGDGSEQTVTKIKNLVNLTRLGEDAYCGYCEDKDTSSIIVMRGDALDERTTVLNRNRKVKDQSEAGPSAYCWNDDWSCAVFTRKSKRKSVIYVVRQNNHTKHLEDLYSFKSRFEAVALAVTFAKSARKDGTPDVTICLGSSLGKIAVHRISATTAKEPVTSELHWHSSAVRSLNLVDDDHLISGGEEGVIVLWRLDRGTSSMTFRPRLGASIIDGTVMRPLTGVTERKPSNCILLLSDGCVLEIEVPSLVLVRRIRSWIPSNSLCVAPVGVGISKDESSRYLAVALDNHRRGALTLIDADLRDSTSDEHIIDVSGRNAVSTAEKDAQWRLDEVRYSPDGKFFAGLLSSGIEAGARKRELRVFQRDVEVLRVPMALARGSQTLARGSHLSVTNQSVAVVDPNNASQVVLFTRLPESGDFALERVIGIEPQRAICVSLSDDESCVALLMESGLGRVYSRLDGETVLSHGVALGSSDAIASGIGFTKNSRDIFVWTPKGIDALVAGLNLPVDGLVFASVSPVRNDIVFIKADGLKHRVYTWSGLTDEPVLVDGIEESTDWVYVEWAGETIGWLLKRENGAVHTRGGKHSFVPRRHGSKKLKSLKLRDVANGSAKDSIETTKMNLTGASVKSLVSAEWCRDLPTHLLPTPPPVDMVWPSVAIKLDTTVLQKQIEPITKQVSLSHSSKRRKRLLEGGDTGSDTRKVVVEEMGEADAEVFRKALKGTNGKSS